MNKAIKVILIAASAAAITGVGTVSFAMWSADERTVNVTGSTGSVNTVGSLTVTPSTASGSISDGVYSMNALYPVNQGGSCLTYWEFTVTAAATDGGTPTVTVQGTLTKNAAPLGADKASLFYSATAPSGGAVEGAENISAPKNITMASTGDTTVYIYMISESADAMGATVSLTFTASVSASSGT